MNRINRSILMALLGLSFSGPCWALGESDLVWNAGIAAGRTAAQNAAAWQPQGLKPLPVVSNYLDLSQLERKLKELNSKIKMDMSFTKPTTGPGFYCDEGNPPAINSLLTGGNAEQAGIKLGDRLLKINGQNITDYYTQIGKVSGDVIEFTLTTGAKVTVKKQELPTMSPELLNQVEEEYVKCKKTLEELKQQAAEANGDPRAIASLTAQSRALDANITLLGDVLQKELERYLGLYKNAPM